MRCPNCGSGNVTSQVYSHTTQTQNVKGFGWIKACLGWFILGPFGILCGLCGMGKGRYNTETRNKVEYICQDCGRRF